MQCVMPTASLIPLWLLTSPTSAGLGGTSMRRWSICRRKQYSTFARMLPLRSERGQWCEDCALLALRKRVDESGTRPLTEKENDHDTACQERGPGAWSFRGWLRL